MPTAVGTYCFAAVYNPAPGSSYVTSNDNVSGTVQASECFSVTAPNFTVVKTDVPTSGTSVAPGSTIAYTVAVKNVGDGAGSATVTDAVPSSLTVKGTPACAVTSPDTCSVSNPSGSTWTFTVSLAAGDSATVTFSATVASNATGSITNTATITTGPCTTAAGCSSSVTNPIITTAAAVVTASTPTPTPTTTATTTPPKTSPATIAFTGALLSQEWMAGLAALILGSGLVLLARWRRRSPEQAASKK
jgi:fimbrial isopeptide formation D2 family protein